jgi:TRAP-type C4-dicarboxylate transport system permease small subunit
MREALVVCVGCLMAVFVISLVVGSYFWIRASLNRRRPSQRWYVHTNPLNAVLFKDELTPHGLEYRGKAFRAQMIALISIAVLTVASAILDLTKVN